MIEESTKMGVRGDTFLKKQPKLAARYDTLVKRYTVKENFQVNPAKQMIVPNDRASKKIFNLTLAEIKDD